MSRDSNFTNVVVTLLRPLVGRVEAKGMFDATGLSLDGTLFGVISGGKLFYRTDEHNRGDFDGDEPEGDFFPVSAIPGDVSYREVPHSLLEDAENLAELTRRAWEAGRRASRAAQI